MIETAPFATAAATRSGPRAPATTSVQAACADATNIQVITVAQTTANRAVTWSGPHP